MITRWCGRHPPWAASALRARALASDVASGVCVQELPQQIVAALPRFLLGVVATYLSVVTHEAIL